VGCAQTQEADCVGYKSNPYDALIDQFEAGETAEAFGEPSTRAAGPLVELIGRIVDSGRKAPIEIMEREYRSALQEKFAPRSPRRRLGLTSTAGRLDVSLHPFCSGIGPGDTRLTTRL